MRNFRIGFMCFLATLVVALLIGCGQETVSIPGVVSVTPAPGAIGVAINTNVTATFSMPMSAATITASTFTLTGPGGTPVTGAVSYSGLTATLTPAAALAYGATYTATVTTGAATPGGAELISNYIWTFTTVLPPPIVPTVLSTIPANGAMNVSIGQVLSATFSEPMASGTINASTFTLAVTGGAAVVGTVAYAGGVATFTPTAPLTNSTSYTATLTIGVTSLGGAPLASNYVWTFTTITPPPLVVSVVPVDTATGVPVDQVISATFNEAMSCLPFPAAAFTVTGPGATHVPGTIACSGAVVTFTPADNLAFNTVFTATITTGATSLAGTPLAANYVWKFRTVPAPTPPAVISTVPVNGAVDVPTNQAVSAAFSEAMSSATINTSTFTLAVTGGAPVTGVVDYVPAGSVATFTPDANLLPTTEYTATITTEAMNLDGTGLAQNYTWTFTTAALPIAVPPTVILTIPADQATNVPFNQIVSATFSVPMKASTINGTTFTLAAPGNVLVPGLVAYSAISNSLTFTPTSNLAPSTTFTATITTGAEDLAGTALENNYVWTFTTGAAPLIIPPEIVLTVPANAAANVPVNQAVSAKFSEAMNPLTITTATFTLAGPGGVAVHGTVSYDAINFIATFTPKAHLANSTTYIATITSGATDVAGNSLGDTGMPNPWSFTTGAAIVVPPPIVLGPAISLFGGFGGGAGMTNMGTSTIVNADIGTTGASTTITKFYDKSVMVGGVPQCNYTAGVGANYGLVTGKIYTNTPPPTVGCPTEGTAATDAIATQAALEAQTAYTTIKNLPPGKTLASNELGNIVLAPGTYTSATFYDITAGDLTLDAKGDPNAYWIFQMGTYLTVGEPGHPRNVLLVNGAKASNVFWQVGSATTINGAGGGTMVGTIISEAGIAVSTAGNATVTTIDGRLLALTASTTLVNTVINLP